MGIRKHFGSPYRAGEKITVDELDLLDKSKTYYVFCRTERRSLRVCLLMKNSNFQVYHLDGEIVNK